MLIRAFQEAKERAESRLNEEEDEDAELSS
jgi:hypothetical protein